VRTIKGEGQRRFMGRQIVSAITFGNQVEDPTGEVAKLIRSNTVDGRFLRRLLAQPLAKRGRRRNR
jgi:hypothetical protein